MLKVVKKIIVDIFLSGLKAMIMDQTFLNWFQKVVSILKSQKLLGQFDKPDISNLTIGYEDTISFGILIWQYSFNH